MRQRKLWIVALLGCGLVASTAAAEPAVKPNFSVSGLAQIDWVAFRQSSEDEIDPSSREPLNQDRLLLRRGRIRLGADYAFTGGRFELDANSVKGLSVRPFEAFAFARWPEDAPLERFSAAEQVLDETLPPAPNFGALLSAGLRRIPFGFEAAEPDQARPILERSLASRAFFGQARDFGVGADLLYGFLRISAALMNGEPLSDDTYAGRDLTSAKDLTGRAGVSLSIAPAVSLQAGVSWLSGTGLHRGTPASKDTIAWVDGNEDGLISVTELTAIPGAPATPSRTFQRSALGADLRLGVRTALLGELSLRAEIVRAVNLDRTLLVADPVAAGRELRELGAYVGVSQEFTRHAEAAVRYEIYDPDADASRKRAGAVVPRDSSYRTLSLALAAKLEAARLVVEYDYNDNTLGRTASGTPTRLRDDAVTVRAEVKLQ